MIMPVMKRCECGHAHFHILADRTQLAAACVERGTFIVGQAAIRALPDVEAKAWKFKVEENNPTGGNTE